jgi:hypothetical protein
MYPELTREETGWVIDAVRSWEKTREPEAAGTLTAG